VVLVGDSGAGKTTLLNIISGLMAPDSGTIAIDGVLVERADGGGRVSVPPRFRSIGYVPQNYILFPFLSAYDNVAFGLKGRLQDRDVSRTVDSILSTLELEGVAHLRPGQLSGGQKQRVALARALAIKPKVLLMDEPLSSLDVGLRGRVREEIAGFLSSFKTTTLYVTHDLDDAFALGDRVAVLVAGRVVGIATMDELLNHPPTFEVARSLGLNCYLGEMIDAKTALIEGTRLVVGRTELDGGSDALICFRPDSVKVLDGESEAEGNVLTGRVISAYEGRDVVQLSVNAGMRIECCLMRRQYERADIGPGKEVKLLIDPSDIHACSRPSPSPASLHV